MATLGRSQQPFTFSLETPSLSSGTLDKYLKSVLGESSASAIPDLLRPPSSSENSSSQAPSDKADGQASTSSGNLVSITSSTSKESNGTTSNVQSTSTSVIPVEATPGEAPREGQMNAQLAAQSINQQLATTGGDDQLIPAPRGQNYIDITDYLNMPQSEAAKKLGIPPSTLSKRWKEAVRKRKWPYRMICKIDKEIMTLLHNVPQGPNAPPLSEEIETALGGLLRKRQEELRPVVIRI